MHAMVVTSEVDGGAAGDALCSAGWGAARHEIVEATVWDRARRGMVATARQSGAVDGTSRAQQADGAVDAAATSGRRGESGLYDREWEVSWRGLRPGA
jgi:hypothetical protein